MKRRAKIIATIGPATQSQDKLNALMEAGMDAARLNMSHGEHETHRQVFNRIRQMSQERGRPMAILLDLQGPKIRTGQMKEGESVCLATGSRVALTGESVLGTAEKIRVSYPFLSQDLSRGDTVLLDDGRLELEVLEVGDDEVLTEVINGGEISSSKGVNFPGVQLSVPSLSSKDLEDLQFGIDLGVDAIALSFVRSGQDILELRDAIEGCGPRCEHIPVIAKLERPEALEYLEEIFDEADGVMIARGDLGVEIPPERLPSLQKRIIQMAITKRRTVITATQMLDSMMHNPRPTRAEATDIANAIFDGSDALMLSGETAIGDYPIQAVRTMERIIVDAESHAADWGIRPMREEFDIHDDAVATTLAARELAHDRGVEAIAVFTRSGRTAKYMSNTRPEVPILAFTPDKDTYHQTSLLWGVESYLVPMSRSVEEMIDHVEDTLVSMGKIPAGRRVVIVASYPVGAMGPTNFTLLHAIR
jgi:pyruvate kinase